MKYNYAVESKTNNSFVPANLRGYSADFEDVWRAHSKQIFRVAERITKNREDAEDAVQESFLRAYVHLHSFDGHSSLATWLTRIAINSALMILRKRSKAPHVSIDETGDYAANSQFAAVADRAPSPEVKYAQRERQDLLRLRIRELRPANRQAIELRSLADHSLKETAEKIGISVSAAKSRIFHAKTALRKSMEPKFGRRVPVSLRPQLSPA